MNKVILSGYIATDITIAETTQGTKKASFRLAVKRPRTKEDKTDFINIVAWRSTAEFISKFFHKGSGIEISGIIATRKYQDKDGNNRYSTEIVVEEVDFGKQSEGNRRAETQSSTTQSGDFTDIEDDSEVPF